MGLKSFWTENLQYAMFKKSTGDNVVKNAKNKQGSVGGTKEKNCFLSISRKCLTSQ